MDNLTTALSQIVETSSILTDKVSSVNVTSEAILSRLLTLEDQVESLKYVNAEVIGMIIETINQSDKEIVINISEPVSGTTTVTAKDINVKNLSVADGNTKLIATDDVTIKSFSTSGDLPKAKSNSQVSINTDGYVKITQSDIDQTSYNAIEVGLNTIPKSVIIDGVSFNSALTNNAISIFGTQDGGTITISNCNFAKCSNPIRLSNKTGGKVTVNIIDCTFGEWETIPAYAGMICCEDYTSKSVETEIENNLFAPDKVTINIINCTKGGNKITMTTSESVCATSNADTQLLYVFNDVGKAVAYDINRYPTLTIK